MLRCECLPAPCRWAVRNDSLKLIGSLCEHGLEEIVGDRGILPVLSRMDFFNVVECEWCPNDCVPMWDRYSESYRGTSLGCLVYTFGASVSAGHILGVLLLYALEDGAACSSKQ